MFNLEKYKKSCSVKLLSALEITACTNQVVLVHVGHNVLAINYIGLQISHHLFETRWSSPGNSNLQRNYILGMTYSQQATPGAYGKEHNLAGIHMTTQTKAWPLCPALRYNWYHWSWVPMGRCPWTPGPLQTI